MKKRDLHTSPEALTPEVLALELSQQGGIVRAISRRVPRGVVCLLSALRVHQLGTQNPFEVWLAVGIKAHKPRLDYPPVRVVRFSALALELGIEVREIEGVAVRLTNPARTVVDWSSAPQQDRPGCGARSLARSAAPPARTQRQC